MELVVASVAERPEWAALLDDFPGTWPEYVYHHATSALFYDAVAAEYAEFCLVAVDPLAPGRAVAKAYSMPVAWDPLADLPPGGHDAVILQAAGDRLAGRRVVPGGRGRLVAAVEVTVQTSHQGRGVSGRMIEALRANAARLGYTDVVVPVRPTGKHRFPFEPLSGYLARTRPDGLPEDPWLRTHLRAGGRVVGIAPYSMTLTGTLAEWRAWTGLPFDISGPVVVPEALVPVHCDVVNDSAVYVEPNVWVRHAL